MIRLICAFFAVILMFSACTVLDRTPTIYYNESEFSLDDVTQMRHSISDDQPKSVTLIPCDDADADEAVYWTGKGEVWHLDIECGYVKEGSTLFYGSEESALEHGKTKACSGCSEK